MGTRTSVHKEQCWQKNRGTAWKWAGTQKKTSKLQRSEILEQCYNEKGHGTKQTYFLQFENMIIQSSYCGSQIPYSAASSSTTLMAQEVQLTLSRKSTGGTALRQGACCWFKDFAKFIRQISLSIIGKNRKACQTSITAQQSLKI